MLETLRDIRSSKINVKTNKQYCFPDVSFKANVQCENYDQRLQLQTKYDKG